MRVDNLIFDGRHLMYRTSDAFRILTTEVGGREIGCGGMYGFLNVAMRIFRRYGGRVYVAWEGKRANNFRKRLYPDYKFRPEPDEDTLALIRDMAEQERRLMAMLRAMGVRQYAGANCEADDVMAWLAHTRAQQGESVIVYTGDSDLRQIVRERIAVVAPGFKSKDVVYDTAEAVSEKHGVVPDLLPDLKALAGDNSDNIPGVKGIGPKTASALLNHYGSLEAVLAHASVQADDWPVAVRHQEAICLNEDIELYKKLTSLLLEPEVTEIPPKRSQRTLVKHFMAYQFRSLMTPSELMDLMKMGGDA